MKKFTHARCLVAGALVTGCALVGAISASAATTATTAAKQASGAYQVGFTDSLTGALSVFTKPELQWAKAVFNSVNASGGIHGHKIVLTALDQGATGSGQATANVTQLATQKHVSAIMGMLISNDCSATAAVADRYQTPLICQRASASTIHPVDKYVFLDTDSETMEVSPQIAFLDKLLAHKVHPKVAILHSDETGADAWAAEWAKDAGKHGLRISTSQVAAETATNMNAQIASVVASKPDAVVAEIFPQFYQPLEAALKAAHLNVPIVTTSGSIFGSLLQAINDPKLYETTTAKPLQVGAKSNTPAQKALLKQLKAQGLKTTKAVNDVEGTMYAPGPYAIVAGLQRCGYPCPGPKMAAALEHVSTTVAGLVPRPFAYSRSLHVGVKEFVFMRWNASKHALVVAATKPAGAF